MNNSESRVIGLTECEDNKKDRHLFFVRQDKALCEYKIGFEDIDIFPDYVDVRDYSDNICPDCLDEYKEWVSKGGTRSPTVKCKCDVMTNEGPETCNTIVSAYKARELSHPTSDINMPVCPNCYKWIRSLSSSGVETEYSKAQPWLEQRKTSKIDYN